MSFSFGSSTLLCVNAFINSSLNSFEFALKTLDKFGNKSFCLLTFMMIWICGLWLSDKAPILRRGFLLRKACNPLGGVGRILWIFPCVVILSLSLDKRRISTLFLRYFCFGYALQPAGSLRSIWEEFSPFCKFPTLSSLKITLFLALSAFCLYSLA